MSTQSAPPLLQDLFETFHNDSQRLTVFEAIIMFAGIQLFLCQVSNACTSKTSSLMQQTTTLPVTERPLLHDAMPTEVLCQVLVAQQLMLRTHVPWPRFLQCGGCGSSMPWGCASRWRLWGS